MYGITGGPRQVCTLDAIYLTYSGGRFEQEVVLPRYVAGCLPGDGAERGEKHQHNTQLRGLLVVLRVRLKPASLPQQFTCFCALHASFNFFVLNLYS